jgi:glycerophosphoryl diester phosphodiesterase
VRPAVIAHRGASGTAPENTLVAFRRAAACGADMVELDVQLTRDGEVVVVHDFTLDRTTDGTGAIGAWTLAEIRRLDAGTWFAPAFRGEPIPTLGEVLAAIGLPVNVELKPVGDQGLEARTLAAVRGAGALGRVVFSSFDPGSLERLRALTPEADIGILCDGPPGPAAMRLAGRVSARALHVRKDGATPEAFALARAAGLQIRVWTVNEPGEFTSLAAAGAHGVFTDYPERFLQTGTTG